MRWRTVAAVVLTVILVTACGGTDGGSDGTVSEAQSQRQDRTVGLFNDGAEGDATCGELFALRNALYLDTSLYYDPALREIGCFSSSSSERTDNPPAASAPASTTSRAPETTTTTRPSSSTQFAQFLQRNLAGTSYSIDSLTSPYGTAQIEAHTYFAESICRDLKSGKNESDLRRARASEEVMGEPSLDKDIPAYVDAIFSAAKTYICP